MDAILDRCLQQEVDLAFGALALWREARGEAEEVQRGVAYSMLNRCRRRKQSLQDVVCAPLQYSSMTALGDPQLRKWPRSADASWKLALRVMNEAICGASENPVGPDAVNYHDTSIAPPKWARPEWRIARLGRIIFYKED